MHDKGFLPALAALLPTDKVRLLHCWCCSSALCCHLAQSLAPDLHISEVLPACAQ